MRISNQTPGSSTDAAATSIARADTASTTPRPHLSSSSASEVSTPDVGIVPSFELLNLNAVLAQAPSVRQDVVSETLGRLQSGQLQSPAALEQTANAILGR